MTALRPTVDWTEPTVAFDMSGPKWRPARCQLIEGSRPDLTNVTLDLLKQRLRTVSLLLFAGLTAFLVKELITNLPGLPRRPYVMGLHLLAVLVTGVVGFRLCVNCPVLLRHLRLAERLVFGVTAAFFSALSYEFLLSGAADGFVPSIRGLWLVLIFAYAMFVPNTWQRSLWMIVPLAALPVSMMLLAWLTSADVRAAMSSRGIGEPGILETAMSMLLGAAIAVWGVRNVRALRHEAFEAKQWSQYRLKRLLGSGGMGDVYIAEHTLLKRPCAIKLIRPEAAGDPDAMARFEREVQATAKLTHWNTVEIYDYGRTEDGTFYYVMEYLPGMTLAELVQRYGPLPPGRVIYLLAQTCEALAEAHERGMVHRDLKPANIFAAKRGRNYDVAKLLDFGLVRNVVTTGDMAQTAQHTITGSPLFMSPEQAMGKPVDARSDIYSLGVVAYVLLTGELPFKSDNPIEVILAHVREPLVWPAANHIPADLQAAVARCLEKDPGDRFQEVDQLKAALAACDAAGQWDAAAAAEWWQCHGCPQRKRLDDAVLEGEPALA